MTNHPNRSKRRPKSGAQRMQALRDRHRDQGRIPIQVWVQPRFRTVVKTLEAELQGMEDATPPRRTPVSTGS